MLDLQKKEVAPVLVKRNNSLNNYVAWLQSISWKKFMLFLLLVGLTSGFIQDISFAGDNEVLHNLTVLFMLVSFGIKVLSNKPTPTTTTIIHNYNKQEN